MHVQYSPHYHYCSYFLKINYNLKKVTLSYRDCIFLKKLRSVENIRTVMTFTTLPQTFRNVHVNWD